MNATPAAAHLSDADLVRHLDLEGDAVELDRREMHLRACEDCAGRARRMGAQSDVVRGWLARADHEHRPASLPAPRRRGVEGGAPTANELDVTSQQQVDKDTSSRMFSLNLRSQTVRLRCAAVSKHPVGIGQPHAVQLIFNAPPAIETHSRVILFGRHEQIEASPA